MVVVQGSEGGGEVEDVVMVEVVVVMEMVTGTGGERVWWPAVTDGAEYERSRRDANCRVYGGIGDHWRICMVR